MRAIFTAAAARCSPLRLRAARYLRSARQAAGPRHHGHVQDAAAGRAPPVFPQGVPGVPQGVPPDLVKGYQPPPEAPPPVVEAKPARPKPKKTVAAPPAPRQPQRQRAATAATAAAAKSSRRRSSAPPRSRSTRARAEPRPCRVRSRPGRPMRRRRRRSLGRVRSADVSDQPRIQGGAPCAAQNHSMSFTLAIVGRPNVGKSTLFNRLVGRRLALVDDRPGVTRDRREGQARLGDLSFTVVDTAGFDEAAPGSLTSRMVDADRDGDRRRRRHSVPDGRAQRPDADRSRVRRHRARAGKPVIVVANKSEGRAGAGAAEAYELGLGDPIPVSAEHGEGSERSL